MQISDIIIEMCKKTDFWSGEIKGQYRIKLLIDGFKEVNSKKKEIILKSNFDKSKFLYNTYIKTHKFWSDDDLGTQNKEIVNNMTSLRYRLNDINKNILHQFENFIKVLNVPRADLSLDNMPFCMSFNDTKVLFSVNISLTMYNRNSGSKYICSLKSEHIVYDIFKERVKEVFDSEIDIFNDINLNYMLRDYLV